MWLRAGQLDLVGQRAPATPGVVWTGSPVLMASSGGSKLVIYVPQGRRHDPVAQTWHHNAETGVGAGYWICPVTKSTSMTSCSVTNSAVTQSFFSPAPGSDLVGWWPSRTARRSRSRLS